ncbi:hypothetical protein [Zavarzinella formosa]|uniref:hypothetical protein n=1 Tax=Zavarzinella formosa TaxID=360055 RepID=UPI0003091D6B|nr:hypothetical protein [Zavarzinella formosa]
MRWRKTTIAGLVFGALSGGLTGCSPFRPLVVPNYSDTPNRVSPGQSKDGSGLADQEETPASGPELDKSPAPDPELGKSPGSVTDDEVRDSNAAGKSGGISLAGERTKMFPLPQQVRRANDESPGQKILPPKTQDPDGNTPRPLIPTPIPVVDAKKPVEGPKIVNGPYTAGRPADLNLRSTPTASGAMLNLGPNDSAVERAVELAKLLDGADAENRSLNNRVKTLELALENREKMLREDEGEITKASQDLVQSRAELQRLRDEFVKVRAKLKMVEKEDLDTLRLIIQALEKLLDAPPPG